MNRELTRLYFNIVRPDLRLRDPEGTLLASLEEARAEAVADARAMMSDAVLQGLDVSGRSIDICNEAGNVLMSVDFREAIVPAP